VANLPLVNVAITLHCHPFDSARTKAEEIARTLHPDAGGAWVISQSLGDDIFFKHYSGSLPRNFERSIAGRVFSAKGELRWLREGGDCEMWLTEESASGNLRYRRRKQLYYLWGMYREKDKRFSENRTFGEFEYPMPSGVSPSTDQRAYIQVAEYLAAPPEKWPAAEDELERILNQPEVTAHRYLAVNVGTGDGGKQV
jgi:hypothetical protein